MTEVVEKRIKGYENYSKIREERKIKNDCKVALLSGVDRSTFTRWSKGVSAPKTDTLMKIAKALKVNVSKLIV